MPREKINDETTTGFYTEVSWRKQPTDSDVAEQGSAPGHVQIASVNALSPFSFPDIDTGDHFEAGEKFDGWRVTLDETGIDHLIKTLHKAKRQAFGGEFDHGPLGAVEPPLHERMYGLAELLAEAAEADGPNIPRGS